MVRGRKAPRIGVNFVTPTRGKEITASDQDSVKYGEVLVNLR